MDAPTDNRPIVVRATIDKVQEEELAWHRIGTTKYPHPLKTAR